MQKSQHLHLASVVAPKLLLTASRSVARQKQTQSFGAFHSVCYGIKHTEKHRAGMRRATWKSGECLDFCTRRAKLCTEQSALWRSVGHLAAFNWTLMLAHLQLVRSASVSVLGSFCITALYCMAEKAECKPC